MALCSALRRRPGQILTEEAFAEKEVMPMLS